MAARPTIGELTEFLRGVYAPNQFDGGPAWCGKDEYVCVLVESHRARLARTGFSCVGRFMARSRRTTWFDAQLNILRQPPAIATPPRPAAPAAPRQRRSRKAA